MNNKKIFGMSILLLISLISLNSVFAIDGWINVSGNWNTNSNAITINTNGVLLSTPFDIEANKNYILTATISNSCINFSIADACTKPDGTSGACGLRKDLVIGTPFKLSGPNNHSTFNRTYFKNVQLQITSICGSLQTISDISLKEDISYPNPTACCPAEYCWSGDYCVYSGDWMTNASMPPLLHDILKENWTNSHVNVSAINIATGYRCVLNESRFADWKLSELKYDWNFEKSGYCARETDCFADYGRPDNNTAGIFSTGCIPSGTFIDDNYQTGSGNHYCHQGNWTTKSYVIATFLQNITTGSYVVHCYDDVTKAHNYFGNSIEYTNFVASCILSQPKSKEVITGVVLATGVGQQNVQQVFLNSLLNEYNTTYTKKFALKDCINAVPTGELNFTTCVEDEDLNIYYTKQYDYFIISTKKITQITDDNFIESAWNGIKNFFKSIFVKEPAVLAPYNSIQYTTSYDRIYILKNNTVNVTALEEKKYDEIEQKQVTVLYAEYIGTNNSDNLIDHNTIISVANKSVIANENTLLQTTYSYEDTLKIQKIIIKTDEKTGLWAYFAPSLRLQ